MSLKPLDITRREGESQATVKSLGRIHQKIQDFPEGYYGIAAHANLETADILCVGCKETQRLMLLRDSSEAKTPLKDVVEVTETDSWDEVLNKISKGIMEQVDQAKARLKATQQSEGYLINKYADNQNRAG